MNIYISTYIHIYICMYTYMHMYIYICCSNARIQICPDATPVT